MHRMTSDAPDGADRGEYLTVGEVAQYLQVSRTYVTNRIKAGDLHALNLGTEGRPRWRISMVSLARWVERRMA